MCEPATIIALASTAATAVGGVMQANAQEDALEASAEAQAEEKGAQIQQQVGERVAQGRRERARLAVAAGESGIAANSNSFEAQIQNSFATQNKDVANARLNAQFATRGINTRAASQAGNIRSGLQIAGQAAGGVAGALANRPAGTFGSTRT